MTFPWWRSGHGNSGFPCSNCHQTVIKNRGDWENPKKSGAGDGIRTRDN